MTPREIESVSRPNTVISDILARLNKEGPVNHSDLNILASLKLFYPKNFKKFEPQLMYLLGLFYKAEKPKDILSLVYNSYKEDIEQETGNTLTPVQASIRQNIISNRYFSFSAPTSAGKSFLLRDILKKEPSNILIVVPSRALISEYLAEIYHIFEKEKDVLILQFIDDINKLKTRKKVFVVTPERALEAVKSSSNIKFGLMIFDEAQISEEITRGIGFDTFVRRSDVLFPNAKKIFAHPFIENPEAQLIKHNFKSSASSQSYNQGSVGKVFIQMHSNGYQYLFSPFTDQGHLLKHCIPNGIDRAREAIISGESLLVFTSKASIISGSYKNDFSKYLKLCPDIENVKALKIIEEIQDLIGAKRQSSDLVNQMRKGIVIHHGSIPLSVRTLIEKFTRLGYARICFATSTLAQGVNMPFKVIWVYNIAFQGSKENKSLGLKNLIGRAGRTSHKPNNFDYGFVITENVKVFTQLFQQKSRLSEESKLDQEAENLPDDWKEVVDAVKSGTMNEDLNLPQTKVERLNTEAASNAVETILATLFVDGIIITSTEYSKLEESRRNSLKKAFHTIYELSLQRPLESGEKAILSAAVTILLMKIQGRSFKEILAIRYKYITKQPEQEMLHKRLKNGEIDQKELDAFISKMEVGFSMGPDTLPNKHLKNSYNHFKGINVLDFSYDMLVYDTYDYLDKVISFSLTDIFTAAFTLHFQKTNDLRSQMLTNYFRYGTSDKDEVLLLRYGFTLDEIDEIRPYIKNIDEDQITFKKSLSRIKQSRALILAKRYYSKMECA